MAAPLGDAGDRSDLPSLNDVAALVTRQSADLSLYAGFLFSALGGALPPEHLIVERERGIRARLRSGEPPVVAVSVLLGEERFVLRRHHVGGLPSASIGHEVGGIVLRSDSVPLGEWAARLAVGLRAVAARNEVSARALAQFTQLDLS